MEYVGGGTLYDYVKNGGAFKEDVALVIALQLLDGLDFIHELGVVHLDLKLLNVLVGLDTAKPAAPKVLFKIGDFGSSQITGSPDVIN